MFAGLAAAATAVQAFVSWETRGEVARSVLFAQRIDACAGVLAATDFLAPLTSADREAALRAAAGSVSPIDYFFGQTGGGREAAVSEWRPAAARYRIVMPEDAQPALDRMDRAFLDDFAGQELLGAAEFAARLPGLRMLRSDLIAACRTLPADLGGDAAELRNRRIAASGASAYNTIRRPKNPFARGRA